MDDPKVYRAALAASPSPSLSPPSSSGYLADHDDAPEHVNRPETSGSEPTSTSLKVNDLYSAAQQQQINVEEAHRGRSKERTENLPSFEPSPPRRTVRRKLSLSRAKLMQLRQQANSGKENEAIRKELEEFTGSFSLPAKVAPRRFGEGRFPPMLAKYAGTAVRTSEDEAREKEKVRRENALREKRIEELLARQKEVTDECARQIMALQVRNEPGCSCVVKCHCIYNGQPTPSSSSRVTGKKKLAALPPTDTDFEQAARSPNDARLDLGWYDKNSSKPETPGAKRDSLKSDENTTPSPHARFWQARRSSGGS